MCNEKNRTIGDVLDYLRTSYDCIVINVTKPNFPGIYVCETDRILWYKNLKHTTTENYENDGKDWYCRSDDDNKMTYKDILSTTCTWAGQFNTYNPTYCEENNDNKREV